jgi:hypothetical protein
MNAFLETSSQGMKMPLVVREQVLQFLYSFDWNALNDRYVKLLYFDMSRRPFIPKFDIARVPQIHVVLGQAKYERAVARKKKYALTRRYSE